MAYAKKLIERHPNIFGTQPGYEGITDWDALKKLKEKGAAAPWPMTWKVCPVPCPR